MVLFIHRPEYYKSYQDEAGRDLRGKAEIIIAKHRNGAVGHVPLTFRGEYARFQNPDDPDPVSGQSETGGEAGDAIMSSRVNGNSAPLPPPPMDQIPPADMPFLPPSASEVPY